MTTQSILQLLQSDRIAAREQGLQCVVSQYARQPVPCELLAALRAQFAKGPPWSDRLVSALLCGSEPTSMAVLLGLLAHGTREQQRKAVGELWHRQPEGPVDGLHALLEQVAEGAGPLAFDAANVLASRGHRKAIDRLVELLAVTEGNAASLRHYALETLAPPLRRAVDEALVARGMNALAGATEPLHAARTSPKIDVVVKTRPEQALRALLALRTAFGASLALANLQASCKEGSPLVLVENAEEDWARSVLRNLPSELASCVTLRRAGVSQLVEDEPVAVARDQPSRRVPKA